MAAWRAILAILVISFSFVANAQERALFSSFVGDLDDDQLRILQQLETAQIVERLSLVKVDIEAFSGLSVSLALEQGVSVTVAR